jgi:hypothetical protein
MLGSDLSGLEATPSFSEAWTIVSVSTRKQITHKLRPRLERRTHRCMTLAGFPQSSQGAFLQLIEMNKHFDAPFAEVLH